MKVSVAVVTLAGWALAAVSLNAQTVIEVPIERAWAAARTVFSQFAIPVNLFSTADYQVGNRGYRPRRIGAQRRSQYLDCGAGPGGVPGADEYSVTMSVVTTLQSTGPASTTVSTLVTATARRNVTDQPIQCTSNGNLEQQIAGLLATAPKLILPVITRTSGRQLSATLGYLRMGGAVGHPDSDRGFHARLGFQWATEATWRWGIEVTIARLNQLQDTISGICYLPTGAGAPCAITSRTRDLGTAVLLTTRIGRHGSARVTPYVVLGAGSMFVWTSDRREGRDQIGNVLEPFTAQRTYRNIAVHIPVGLGVDLPGVASGVAARIEARLNGLATNGGVGWSPSLEMGINWFLDKASQTGR